MGSSGVGGPGAPVGPSAPFGPERPEEGPGKGKIPQELLTILQELKAALAGTVDKTQREDFANRLKTVKKAIDPKFVGTIDTIVNGLMNPDVPVGTISTQINQLLAG